MIPVPDSPSVKHLPAIIDIPEEFDMHDGDSKWIAVVETWHKQGLTPEVIKTLTPKPGVDTTEALMAVSAILRSWMPQHEHKIAGCAYLMSEWFE